MNSPSPKGFIPPGFLTLLCEGNNNPYSTNWSRRLRTGPKNNIVIGKGYDLTQNGEKQIVQDLVEAGVTRQKAQLLARAPSLSGFEASKFIAFYKNDVVLTKEQEKKLFEMKYKKTESIMKAKIDQYTGKSEYISPFDVAQYQWEILTDLIYSGDLTPENEEYVFLALKNALNEHDPKLFDSVVLDAHYWRKQGVVEDRLRMRCIFMNEWASFTELKNLPREEADDNDGFVAMLSKFPDLFSIEGLYVDLKQDNLNLVLKRNIAQANPKKKSAGTGISIEELVMALKLCCDKNINASIIGGSLKPLDPFNPEEKGLKKELYPDHYHSKPIVAGTKFAEVMYEASKIITQIATGKNIVDKGNYLEKEGDFEHLQAFKEMGISPLKNSVQTEKDFVVCNPLTIKRVSTATATVRLKHSLLEITQTPRSLNSPVNDPTENRIVKFWLTIDYIKEVKHSSPEGEYFGVSDVKLGLKPCKIYYSAEGTWEERPIDDPSDQAYIFAKRFTEKYPLIAKLFPVFKKVEQMCKALSLTNWLNKKNVPVDMVMVNIYYQKGLQYISSPRQTVFGSQTILSPSKKTIPRKGAHVIMIPPESRSGRSSVTGGERSMSQTLSKPSSTRLFNNYWPDSMPLSPVSPSSPKKNSSLPVFGGVLLEVGYQNPVKKNLVSGILENHAQVMGNFLETIFQDTFQIEYPFQNTMCKVCENYLKYSEIMSSINGDYYCRLHHPFSCNHCFNIIKANCFDLDGKKYHSDCILCRYCEKKISGKLVKIEEGYLHVQCSEVYLKNWRRSSVSKPTSPKNTPKNKGQGRNRVNFRTLVGLRT